MSSTDSRLFTKIICALILSLAASGWALKHATQLSAASAKSTGLHGASPEWRSYGGDPGGTRFSPLTQINRSNVSRLTRAWTYHTGEVSAEMRNSGAHRIPSFEATPLEVDGVLYFSTPANRVIALNAETGRQIWAFNPQQGHSGALQMMQNRGVSYWEGAARNGQGRKGVEIDKRIFYGTFDGRLIALDARTGKLCPDFGNGGWVDLRRGVGES